MSEVNDILAVHHEGFVREGFMTAMPLGFPGATTFVDPNDSYVTALTIDRRDRYETFYGGTSGRNARLFFGWIRGVTGIIVDLGGDGESAECGGVAAVRHGLVAALNRAAGARLLTRHRQDMSWDCTQEWFVDMKPYAVRAELPGRRITAVVPDGREDGVAGIANGGLFLWNGRSAKVRLHEDVQLTALTRTGAGALLGVDGAGEVLAIGGSAAAPRIKRLARLRGDFSRAVWSGPSPARSAWLADAGGRLFRVEGGRVRAAGEAPLGPVTCLAPIPDGRVFGFCGEGIAQAFVWEPPRGPARKLGVGLSVLNRRRYGYAYGCAAVNRDGHVLFGENDRGGHVWVYCPALAQGAR